MRLGVYFGEDKTLIPEIICFNTLTGSKEVFIQTMRQSNDTIQDKA